MMLRWKIAGFAALAFLVWLVSASFFSVTQGTEALVIRFGKPVKTVTQAGLHMKAPLIDVVVTYDARLLALEPPAEQRQAKKRAFAQARRACKCGRGY